MSRPSSIPKNKVELLTAIREGFARLRSDLVGFPAGLARKEEIEGNSKGTLVSVSDTLAYLIGWGRLVLNWNEKKSRGEHVDFPETGFRWNELGKLATHFHRKYRDWEFAALIEEWETTVQEILAMVEAKTDRELYGEPWYEKWTLGRMTQFNTSSPMNTMRAKIRRFKKSKELA